MSSFFGQIRRKKSLEQYINELSQRLAIYQATQNRVDNEQYKSVARTKPYKLILRETASAQLGQVAEGPPVVPFEPDGSKVTTMLDFDHGLEDRSTFQNHAIAEFTNNQVLFTEGRDAGFGFAMDFNPVLTATTYDKLWIPFSNTTQIVYDTQDFTPFFRIYPYSLALTPGGQKPCVWIKQDDLDNGAQFRVGADGTGYFNVKKAGVEYKRKTAPGALSVNVWHDIFLNFITSTNTPEIYINNVKYTTASTEVLQWNDTHSHTILANYNMGSAAGAFRGKLDMYRLYRMSVTATQVSNFNANGLSITDAAGGSIFVVNRVKIDSEPVTDVYVAGDVVLNDVPGVPMSLGHFDDFHFSPPHWNATIGPSLTSFTSTSFTSTSFTTE